MYEITWDFFSEGAIFIGCCFYLIVGFFFTGATVVGFGVRLVLTV
jgi:hypothetical protein